MAALGDSLTAGYGLGPEEGFVPQLQDWLDAREVDAVIVNAGLSGDTTAGGLSRVDWTLTDDVDALIVALGANDYLRGLPPEQARENLSGILDAAAAKDLPVLLVGVEVGANYGPDYQAAFDAIYPELAEEYDIALYASWFTALIEEAGSQADLGPWMQADGLHPNAEGVRIIVEGMGPAVEELVRAAD